MRNGLVKASGMGLVGLMILSLVVTQEASASVTGSNGNFSDWQMIRGQHFIIHIEDRNYFGGKTILQKAEATYSRLSSAFGYSDRTWLGEKRCRIFVYRTKRSYLKGTQRPEWSNASSSFAEEGPMVQGYLESPTLLEAELPHEIAHLIFREHVGIDNPEVPLWLDEGIALWSEGAADPSASRKICSLKNVVAEKAASDELIPLERLNEVRAGMAFPGWASQESVSLFYAQSYSLVNYLIHEYGQPRFAEFLKQLEAQRSVEDSLKKNYGVFFRDLSSFEKEWTGSVQSTRSS